MLVLREVMNPAYGLFHEDEESHLIWFSDSLVRRREGRRTKMLPPLDTCITYGHTSPIIPSPSHLSLPSLPSLSSLPSPSPSHLSLPSFHPPSAPLPSPPPPRLPLIWGTTCPPTPWWGCCAGWPSTTTWWLTSPSLWRSTRCCWGGEATVGLSVQPGHSVWGLLQCGVVWRLGAVEHLKQGKSLEQSTCPVV